MTDAHPRPAVDKTAVVLRIEEAAARLRIGRTTAYELARRFKANGGREGLPVIRLGRALRVPIAALNRLVEAPTGTGRG